MTSSPVSDRPGSDQPSLSSSARLSDVAVETLSLAKASERLIQHFGGIRPMANKLEVPVTTVQGWKKRGAIPAARVNDLRVAAQRHGIKLEDAELEAVSRSDDRHAEPLRPAVTLPEPESEPEPGLEPESKPEPTAIEVPPPLQTVPPLFPLASAAPAAASSAPLAHPFPAAVGPTPIGPAAVAAAAARLAASPPPASTGSRLMALGPARLSVAAAAVALIAAALTVWSMPSSTSNAPLAAATGSERRLGDLETKISRVALEQGTQSAALEKKIGALDAKVSRAVTQQTAAELAQRIAVLERDLPALQQRVAAQGIGAPALGVLLSATQLRGVLATSSPFVNELAALRLTGITDPALKQALEQIAGRATAGIATEAWLIGRFSAVQSNILRASSIGRPGARVADLFLDVLSDMAPPLYRLTGASEGAAPRAIADRALAAMAAGDFPHAVETVGELTGLPAEVAAPWLAEAKARVIADHSRTLLAKSMLAIAQPVIK